MAFDLLLKSSNNGVLGTDIKQIHIHLLTETERNKDQYNFVSRKGENVQSERNEKQNLGEERTCLSAVSRKL